jgi:sugar lactone lactonase YvrE
MNAVRPVRLSAGFAVVLLGSLFWMVAATGRAEEAAAPPEGQSVQELAVAESAEEAPALPVAPVAPAAPPAPSGDAEKSLGRPTHKQVGTIDVNAGDLADSQLACFCLAPNGNVLAACGGESGEIRVFNPEGQYITSWPLTIRPEAINVGSDGNIYVAGAGTLLKLDADGNELLRKEAPHLAAINADPEKIRAEVIEQAKRTVESLGEQLKMYDQMIAAIEEKDEADRTAEDTQQLEMLQQIKKQYEQMQEEYGDGELGDEQIDAQVKSLIEYKSRIASISEAGGLVFLATGQAQGYGYCVWKMDNTFEGGEEIVHDLSGCCGQMDVQCSDSGVYVAENSRHRVTRYDNDGKEIASWGQSARSGLQGFGGCCNPMNLAFGADGSVYTAESETGRVKQYSPEGELLSLVGKVDLVPGCKKVAIGVAQDGGHVYMLDITRNHILIMDRLKPGETIAYYESEEAESGGLMGALKSIFGL